MPVKKIEFTRLEQLTLRSGKPALTHLAPHVGKVYVASITRDGCSACERHKPKIERLAQSLAEKYGDKVVFSRVHVNYSPKNSEESMRSKDVFGHYFYPTTLILLKTKDRGPIEYYRNISPRMTELKKNIEHACKTATLLEQST